MCRYYKRTCDGQRVAERMEKAVAENAATSLLDAWADERKAKAEERKEQLKAEREKAKAENKAKLEKAAPPPEEADHGIAKQMAAAARFMDDEAEEGGAEAMIEEEDPVVAKGSIAANRIIDDYHHLLKTKPNEAKFVAEALGIRIHDAATPGTAKNITELRKFVATFVGKTKEETQGGRDHIKAVFNNMDSLAARASAAAAAAVSLAASASSAAACVLMLSTTADGNAQ